MLTQDFPIIVSLDEARQKRLAEQSNINSETILKLVPGEPEYLPLFSSKIRAGFQNPAEGHIEEDIDPTQFLVDNPHATMLLRVEGDSMKDAEIHSGDIIIVDRSLEARVGDIVVAELDGGFTVKYLGKHCLKPANDAYPVLHFKDMQEIKLVGVVISKMKRLRR